MWVFKTLPRDGMNQRHRGRKYERVTPVDDAARSAPRNITAPQSNLLLFTLYTGDFNVNVSPSTKTRVAWGTLVPPQNLAVLPIS